jgi:hypothetical protein
MSRRQSFFKSATDHCLIFAAGVLFFVYSMFLIVLMAASVLIAVGGATLIGVWDKLKGRTKRSL